jgi:hypothetical protein
MSDSSTRRTKQNMFMPLNVAHMGRSIVSEHARRCRSPQPRDTTVAPLGRAKPICRGGFGLAIVVLVQAGSWVFRDSCGLSQDARASLQYLGRLIYRRVNVASTCLASELVAAAGVNRARVPWMLSGESYANRHRHRYRYRRSTLCLHRLTSRFRRWGGGCSRANRTSSAPNRPQKTA